MHKILFPESNNEYIQASAIKLSEQEICEPVLEACGLQKACQMLADGEVDAMVAGIDNSSRDVILACRDVLGMAGPALQEGKKRTFSSLFVADFPDGRRVVLGDGATCKNPTATQLADIIVLINDAAKRILDEPPRIAVLSFSTFGSGGKDPSIDKIHEAIELARERCPGILVDGEMQLDAAVNARIGQKKAPNSEVAGRANVLVVPDINAGNILYKSFEQFGGAHVAGPILLGFKKPVSDLSRGSTVEDIVLTTECLEKLI